MLSLAASAPDLPPQVIRFKFSDIKRATNNFHESSVIGDGGFSTVYKGSIPLGENRDEPVVAIKRLLECQGEREFLAEIRIQFEVRHRNLVSLIGYSLNEEQERIIVSEYMPKGTLEDRLHRREYPPLTLVRRLKILIATGRGLNHLHTGTGINHGVIHRDMKPANILLDDSWEPKICDFGLSRPGLMNQTSDRLRGTQGYVDPLYIESGIPTTKSDVFSFGVTMLEVLCGRRPIDNSLVDQNQRVLRIWVQECVRNNTLTEIVDANLIQGVGAISAECLCRFVQLAMQCLHDTADQRPTMAQVVAGLETILATQEKANKEFINYMNKKIFGSNLNPFKRKKNPVGGTSLKYLKYHLYTVGGENRILHKFSIDTINAASESFSRANKISGDEVGTMYKGKLPNGQDIAIYGPSSDTQYELYKNETSILVNVEHENLIQLLGYCIDGKKVYLVYDFAPYTTLDLLISDCSSAPSVYNQRYKIIQGVARVLLYLHSHALVRVMHFDVKPGKIMLDESLNPKLFGFYFARSTAMTEADCIQIDVAHRISECWAPEYMGTDRPLSTKCDVFNFGVLVLITLTAERILETSNADSLEINVRRKWLKGDYSMNTAESEMMKRFIMVGLLCIQIDATQRPGMEEVVAMLIGTSYSDTLLSHIRAMNKQEWEMQIKTKKSSACLTDHAPGVSGKRVDKGKGIAVDEEGSQKKQPRKKVIVLG